MFQQIFLVLKNVKSIIDNACYLVLKIKHQLISILKDISRLFDDSFRKLHEVNWLFRFLLTYLN